MTDVENKAQEGENIDTYRRESLFNIKFIFIYIISHKKATTKLKLKNTCDKTNKTIIQWFPGSQIYLRNKIIMIFEQNKTKYTMDPGVYF